MSQVLQEQRVADMRVEELRVLLEALAEKVLQDYELQPRKYFIDDEGWLCFRDERDYAEYLNKQERQPSEIRACFIENGVKVVYSDEEPLLETLALLEEIHGEIETGALLVDHATLRERLGL
jgi:hypothetical protein